MDLGIESFSEPEVLGDYSMKSLEDQNSECYSFYRCPYDCRDDCCPCEGHLGM